MKNGALIPEKDAQMLIDLRQLLLAGDRAELENLRQLLHEKDRLRAHLSPILEEQMDFIRQNFPAEYRAVVRDLVDDRIRESQGEIVDVLYPVLGNLIKKYIDRQIQLLKENVEAQIAATKKQLNFWEKIKNWRRVEPSQTDIVLAGAKNLELKQIFLIEKDSGIVLAQAAADDEKIDVESVAGMLTAIKSFAEDAFSRGEEQLDLIQYQHSKILMQNYRAYYMVLVGTGPLSTRERDELIEKLENFVRDEFVRIQKRNESPHFYEEMSGLMERHFLKKTLKINENVE
jgi:hypothetical protein